MRRMIDAVEVVVIGVGLMAVLLLSGCELGAGISKYIKISASACVDSEGAKMVCPDQAPDPFTEDTAKEEVE